MLYDVGCPPQNITIMAEEKDYNAIWTGACNTKMFVKPEDAA